MSWAHRASTPRHFENLREENLQNQLRPPGFRRRARGILGSAPQTRRRAAPAHAEKLCFSLRCSAETISLSHTNVCTRACPKRYPSLASLFRAPGREPDWVANSIQEHCARRDRSGIPPDSNRTRSQIQPPGVIDPLMDSGFQCKMFTDWVDMNHGPLTLHGSGVASGPVLNGVAAVTSAAGRCPAPSTDPDIRRHI